MAAARTSISSFFANTLGTPLSNTRWSWGAEHSNGAIFLRVWADERATVEGIDRVHILGREWGRTSAGWPERERQVERLRRGAEGYGVLCVVKDPHALGPRKIAHFDFQNLLKLGPLIDDDGNVYATVVATVAVETVVAQQRTRTAAEDAVEGTIQQRTDIGPTQKAQLVNARRGQGIYRDNLEQIEKGCRVTGIADRRYLRASHIKPWCKSTDFEKLDGYNGLLLSPHIDMLFDHGWISFSDDGKLLLSAKLAPTVLAAWGIPKDLNVGQFKPEQRNYLVWHREAYGLGSSPEKL